MLNHSLGKSLAFFSPGGSARCTARTTWRAGRGHAPLAGLGRRVLRGAAGAHRRGAVRDLHERVPDPPGGRGRPGVRGRWRSSWSGSASCSSGRCGTRSRSPGATRLQPEPQAGGAADAVLVLRPLALLLVLGLWMPAPLAQRAGRRRRPWSGGGHEPGARPACPNGGSASRWRDVPQVGMAEFREARRWRRSRPARGSSRSSACPPPTTAIRLLLVLAQADDRDAVASCSTDVRDELSGADARLPAGPLVRARDRRAVGRRARGPSLAQAHPLPPLVPAGRDAWGRPPATDPAVRDRLLPGRGRGGPRGGRGAGPRRASSSRATSASSATASRSSTWRSRSATSTAASSGRWSAGPTPRTHPLHGDAGRRHDRSATPRPTARRWRRWPACRVRRAREALRGIALELERLANHTGDLGALAGDVGYPAHRLLLRAAARRFPEPDARCSAAAGSAAAWSGPAAWRSTWTRRASPSSRDRLRRGRSGRGRRGRPALGHRRRCWPGSRRPARCRGRSREALGLVGRGRAGLRRWSATCASISPRASTGFAQIPVSTWHSGDVFARAYVRWLEIQRSVDFVREQLAGPAGRADPRRGGPAVARISWWSRWSRAGAARSATSP